MSSRSVREKRKNDGSGHFAGSVSLGRGATSIPQSSPTAAAPAPHEGAPQLRPDFQAVESNCPTCGGDKILPSRICIEPRCNALAAGDPRTSQEQLRQLALSPNGFIARRALKNPNYPLDAILVDIERLGASHRAEDHVRLAYLASNPSTPPSLSVSLLMDGDASRRRAIARSGHVPNAAVEALISTCETNQGGGNLDVLREVVFHNQELSDSAVSGVERLNAPGLSRQVVMLHRPERIVDEVSEEVAAKLHDAWRDSWAAQNGGLRADGSYPERLKDDGAGGMVDIANTRFADLPPTWQAENRASARSAVSAVLLAKKRWSAAAPSEIAVVASSDIHNDWISRNSAWAPADLMVPFDELSSEEQAKDVAVAHAALSAVAAWLNRP